MQCADPSFGKFTILCEELNLNFPNPPPTPAKECYFILNSKPNCIQNFVGKLRDTKGRNTRQSETEACFRPGQYLGGTVQVWNPL